MILKENRRPDGRKMDEVRKSVARLEFLKEPTEQDYSKEEILKCYQL